MLQRRGGDSGVFQLLRGAGRRRKALHLVPMPLCCPANGCQRRSLSSASNALQARDPVMAFEDEPGSFTLRRAQVLKFILSTSEGKPDERPVEVVAIRNSSQILPLEAAHLRSRELPPYGLGICDQNELACPNAGLEILPDLAESSMTLSPVEGILHDIPLVDDGFALDVPIAGEGHCSLGDNRFCRGLRAARIGSDPSLSVMPRAISTASVR